MRTLKELTSITLGYSFRRRIESTSDGNLCIILMKDINKNILNYKGFYKIETDKKIKEDFYISKGDILFSAKGSHNNAVYIERDLTETVASAHFYILRIKANTLLPEYLAWYINQKPAQSYIQKYSRGTAINYINRQNLENLEVAVPDLETQKKITALYNLSVRETELISQIHDFKNKVTNQVLINKVFESNKEDSHEE